MRVRHVYFLLFFFPAAYPLNRFNKRAVGYFKFQIWRMKNFQIYRRIIVGSLDGPARPSCLEITIVAIVAGHHLQSMPRK